MGHEKRNRGRSALFPGVSLHTYKFKDHPSLLDDLDRAVADLAEDDIRASRSDVLRALVFAHRDHLVDITREYLGHDSEYS